MHAQLGLRFVRRDWLMQSTSHRPLSVAVKICWSSVSELNSGQSAFYRPNPKLDRMCIRLAKRSNLLGHAPSGLASC